MVQTINDVVCGIIFYGIRLYMEEINETTKTSNSTAVVMLNTRNIGGYQSLKEMHKHPLEFIWESRKIIQRKRHSFSVHLIGLLMDLEMKLRGPEAVAKIIYDTIGHSSVLFSNLVGPIEKMTLANHPINGLYFTASGGPEDLTVTVISYVKTLRITLKTQKGFINEHKLKFCIEKADELIFKAAMEISETPNKN
ncbi:hypothetical protein TSUD_60500 [Trifolium subterraneum]|uniref:O-acyltransferase WSD1 C-terminal domain-containing protein n=1 Tax=Trifolium subterraneum TaxID=3900 RepID=A0A2Z6NU20_TRISU|nr:hypothetical protein TSUD_60500 [Trifolium subterraneum]